VTYKLLSPKIEYVRAALVRHKRTLPLSGVVQHYTGGGSGRSLVRWVAGKSVWKGKLVPPAKYFAHFTIYRNGHTVQQADLDEVCYHAAGLNSGRWPLMDPKAEINEFTVGIENSNYGWLIRDEKTKSFFVPKKSGQGWIKGRPYPADLPAPQSHIGDDGHTRWWEPFTEELIESNIFLVRLMVQDTPAITAGRILDHSFLSPGRKQDPGPLFPGDRIKAAAFRRPIVPGMDVGAVDDDALELFSRRDQSFDGQCLLPPE